MCSGFRVDKSRVAYEKWEYERLCWSIVKAYGETKKDKKTTGKERDDVGAALVTLHSFKAVVTS